MKMKRIQKKTMILRYKKAITRINWMRLWRIKRRRLSETIEKSSE